MIVEADADLLHRIPREGEVWEHTASSRLYRIEGSTFNSITDQIDVSYVPLYRTEYARFNRQLLNHPKAWLSFTDDEKPRFTRVGHDDPRLPLEG